MTSSEQSQPGGTNRPQEQPDEQMQRLINDALGSYSADGEADDLTGGDAGAEEAFGHEAHARGAEQKPASPDGPRIGPA